MSAPEIEQQLAQSVHAGYAALAQEQWLEGRRCFETALAHTELPAAYEGLGSAAA